MLWDHNLDVLKRHVEHSIAITANGPEIPTRV